MSKKRGPYRRYLREENFPVPRTTRFNILKKARLQLMASSSTSLVNVNLNEIPKASSVQSTIIETTLTNNSTFISYSGESSVESDNNECDQQEDNSFNNPDIENVINDEDVESLTPDPVIKSSEHLAIAYLVAFYNGNITQKSFEDFLKLNNIASAIKLPTSFDGIVNLLLGKRYYLNYNTTLFCSYCSKIIKNLTNRWQRSCESCNNK